MKPEAARDATGRSFEGRYEILGQLGSGSFGSVYQARQLSTGQLVAIKLLAERHRGRHDVERFRREMAICAALSHPNIVGLIDSGETPDGRLYAVFQHVAGETLEQALQREGTLEVREALRLMTQVLDALAEAHAQGIVHRDLKPTNLMLSRGSVRRNALVLDFGLGGMTAELRLGEWERLTQTWEFLGTPLYAAPEQLAGQPATPRSDLFSWGLIFLECLTGRNPFGERGALARLFAGSGEVQIPGWLADHPLGALLARVTARDPAQRDVAAASLIPELEEMARGELCVPPPGSAGSAAPAAPGCQRATGFPAEPPGAGIAESERGAAARGSRAARRLPLVRSRPLLALVLGVGAALALAAAAWVYGLYEEVTTMRSIAVFPFSHIERVAVSPFGHIERQEETARFARSLSESILEALLQVETGSIRRWGRLPFPVGKLKVASRTTSFALAGSGRDISEAADELGVGYVLEGSIQHLGDDLRITARLVRAADGFQVWSKSYDGAFDDRLEMQGVVASNVATVAADRVLWDIRRRYARWGALGLGTNRDAMGYYLAAENQKRLLQLGEGGDPGLQERLLRRAVGADPGFASAWTMLAGNYTMRTGGSLAPEDASRRAHDAIDRALALRPDDPEFQTHLGVIYWLLDLDYAAAEAVLERVLQQSPGIPWVQTALASIALCEGRVQDALQLTKAAMASGNTHTVLLNFHAWTFLIAGDYERALSVAREAWALTGHRPDAIRGVWGDGIPGLISQIMALVQLGRIAEARPLVEEGWKAEGESFPEIYFWLLAAIGEEARARQVLADIAPRLGLSSGYLALGDLDNTFRALRAEVENHDFHTISHLRAGRWWDEIRGDPRFDAVLALLESHETHTEKYLRAQQEAPIAARGDARPSAGL